MPRTKGEAVPRMNIRLPKPMVDEVDMIVEDHPELYNNRQQFVESAIRDGIEKVKILAASKKAGDDLVSRAKEITLAQAIINTVEEKTASGRHFDPRELEEKVKKYLRKRAKLAGVELTEERLDELIKCSLQYHRQISEGLTQIEGR